ncbi:MAG TPA: type II toxin-antitoxin system VapB family antitoxin [Microthrixaceae bacterium]|nr:type II toxin-antitoxin system VapB family antitoxin [Microthrixaceae bacterium]HMU81161.1 type II toxin-antitoxin system VapB family antitoxin [Microthrixaceae bacterium]HMV73290.1 type II toxin-antitoxin system VapB family antitoxin [Microthrixaceae bacterium]HMX07343.1 type II toxin-antitoxin system VapB family antitoxin [Microthrixaceae bacterium]HMX66791.1 type II toxin-antitoxin system VapB family antitoxin [Microthrixaceae bacterium]
MSRTNIDLDDDACAEVMRRYHLATKRDAVNLALRLAAADALSTEQARDLRGSGWDAELEALRTTRVP